MQRRVWLILGLILVGMFILTGPLGAVGFLYEDLGNLGYPNYNGNEAFGINDTGQVVGYAYTSYGTWPFVKSPGQAMQPLPCNDPPNHGGEAVAINGSGIIVGWVANAGERNACQWVKPSLTYNLEPLGFLGGIASGALAINENGQIVGWSWTATGDTRGFVKSQGDDMKPLNPLEGHTRSMATGINTKGAICGLSSKTGEQKPCGWVFLMGGGYIPYSLPSLGFYPPDGQANGLNDSNQIVGYSRTSVGTKHAVLWTGTISMQDLGLLPGGVDSEAKAINNAGWVVGNASTEDTGNPLSQRAFLRISGGNMQDLNKLTQNLPSGVNLMSANAINSRGQIVGQAIDFTAGEVRIYRLTPVVSPPFSLLLLD